MVPFPRKWIPRKRCWNLGRVLCIFDTDDDERADLLASSATEEVSIDEILAFFFFLKSLLYLENEKKSFKSGKSYIRCMDETG